MIANKEGNCKHQVANKLRVLESKIDATVFIVRRKACHHYQFQIKRHGRIIWIIYIVGSKLPMGNSLYETCLQGIMVVAFLKTNFQSKIMNATTMITCRDRAEKRLIGRQIVTQNGAVKANAHARLEESCSFHHGGRRCLYVVGSVF